MSDKSSTIVNVPENYSFPFYILLDGYHYYIDESSENISESKISKGKTIEVYMIDKLESKVISYRVVD